MKVEEKNEKPAEIVVDVSRGHILQIGDKIFKLSKDEKDDDGRTLKREVYTEIDPDTYAQSLRKLALRIEQRAPVKLVDIILDALKDLPLERIARLEDALNEARRDPPENSVEVARREIKSGGCIELKIGKEYLVLRE